MAKAKFDRNDVIHNSTAIFIKNGFHGSSIQQLVDVTGLKPGSLYLAFGNKEGLYKESVDKYATEALASIKDTIENASTIGEGICQLMEQSVVEATSDCDSKCFLVKALVEAAEHSSELREYSSTHLERIELLYLQFLEKEFSPEVSRRRAASIMMHTWGMRIYDFLPHGSANDMRQGLYEGLPWLPWSKNPAK